MVLAGGIVWFLGMVVLGYAGAFAPPPGAPPLALGVAAAAPPLVALALLRTGRGRRWAGERDLSRLTVLQAWRTGGLAFLALAAVGALPLGFALPAGLGDVAVGLTAPAVATLLARRRLHLAWTAFGVLDLVVAVTLGVLNFDRTAAVLPGELTSRPMSDLPMSIVPTFFVPLLLVAHLVAVSAVRRVPATLRT